MVNVGKYTSPMDPMGVSLVFFRNDEEQLLATQKLVTRRRWRFFQRTRWSKTRPNQSLWSTTPSIHTKQTVNFHHSMKKPCAYQKNMRSPETQKNTPDDSLCKKNFFFFRVLAVGGNLIPQDIQQFFRIGSKFHPMWHRIPGRSETKTGDRFGGRFGFPKGIEVASSKNWKKNDRFFVELQGMIQKEMIQHRNSNQLKQS